MASIVKRDLEADFRLTMSWRFDRVDFLGLPSLKENRPLTLEEIYVPLSFTREPGKGERLYLPAVLKESRRYPNSLVVLGDPGSGKSTLVKLITYSFGRAQATPLSRQFGKLLPVPIVLRDYSVQDWKKKEDMLSDFIQTLDPYISQLVTVEWLTKQLRGEGCFLMFDGLDEVGGKDERVRLRDKIIRPLLAEINATTLLTSRIVGYDEAPLEDTPPIPYSGVSHPSPDEIISVPLRFQRYYVAPFNSDDTKQFISKWYSARESDPERRRDGIASLGSAIARNNRIGRLASNPSLLTMIALVHRATAHLPSGRVKLYDKIVEAYLETIQTYRKLGQFPASLDQMKRWLAWVGWNMQENRGHDDRGQQNTFLVSRQMLLRWLADAIGRERDSPQEEAGEFLDFVRRRSGLLFERGPDEFAFVHLTFQEYFAAFYLRSMVGRFDRMASECLRLIRNPFWHETLSLLFEMLAEFPGVGDDLLDSILQSAREDEARLPASGFLAVLALDEESGLAIEKRRRAVEFALTEICRHYFDYPQKWLKQLPKSRFDDWVRAWFLRQLERGRLGPLPQDFFLAGASLLRDWPERLVDWIQNAGASFLDQEQTSEVALLAHHDPSVLEWAASRLGLKAWSRPFFADDTGQTISLVEFVSAALINSRQNEPRWRLLYQLGRARMLGSFLLARLAVFLAAVDGSARRVWGTPDAVLGTSMGRTPLFFDFQSTPVARLRTEATQVMLGLARRGYVERSGKGLPLLLSSALADIAIAATHSDIEGLSLSPDLLSEARRDIEKLPGVSAQIGAAVLPFFVPDAPPAVLKSTFTGLRALTELEDDWSGLLGSTGLLSLGKGNQSLCARRMTLLSKGVELPGEFTFPEELRAETETPEFRADLPEILKHTFFYDTRYPWPEQEWYHPSNAAAPFFLSTPREFYSVAAEVLDPDGETKLAKWRIKKP